MQKIKKNHRVDPEKNAPQMDGQTDRWTDKQDWFYRTPSAKMRFDHVFRKFDNKIFLNHLAWL